MKRVPSSQKVQEANEVVIILKNNLPKILNQKLWNHKISISEKIEYLKQLASANRVLWQTVEDQIPELKGKNYTVSSVEITYQEDQKIN